MNILRRPGDTASTLKDAAKRTTGRGGGPWGTLLAAGTGIGLGAAAAHLLDPDQGRARRARYADQAAAGARRLAHRARQIGRLQAGRLAGVVEQLRHRADAPPMLDDASLAMKVETELFRDPAVPKGAINVNVERGVAVLRGEVADKKLKERIQDLARRIEGVEGVRSLLRVAAEPASTRS